MTNIRFVMSFWSFFKLMTIVAFCTGIVLMPIEAIIAAEQNGSSILSNVRFPSGALIAGPISAITGYPLYWLVATRTSWASKIRGKHLAE